MSEPLTDAMTSDEFLAALHAVLDPLEAAKASGGAWLPEQMAIAEAMNTLCNRWFRRDVKADLSTIDALRAERDRLTALLSDESLERLANDIGQGIGLGFRNEYQGDVDDILKALREWRDQ